MRRPSQRLFDSIRSKPLLILFGTLVGLTGCSQVAEKAETSANRSYTSYALGKPYADIANLGNSPLERLSGSGGASFGQLLGQPDSPMA